MDKATNVLDVWFGRAGDPGYALFRDASFVRGDACDIEPLTQPGSSF
jgi:hypothetical protein